MPTLRDRAAGVLLHPTSLATPYPIGDLGPSAYAFVDFLAAAGLRWWQMLPVGPVGAGFSPYQSASAFAGNPLLISPDVLRRDGWTDAEVLREGHAAPGRHVDYVQATVFKQHLLRRAFERFQNRATASARRSFRRFCAAERVWLRDYALFCALAIAQGSADWTTWDADLRRRRPHALARAIAALHDEMAFFEFQEWAFARQWAALRRYAAERGVGLIGDVPIFVAPNSCDVWAHPRLFQLRADGRPRVVAGVPPDYFAKTGQRWGNPHYDWRAMRREGYRWWIDRIRKNLGHFDALRLDHFIGFVRYYVIPGDAETAEHGTYRAGPSAAFFEAVLRALHVKPNDPPIFIAEDLGTVTPAVKALRDAMGFPGMKVLQFAFGADPEAIAYQPHNYGANAVVYTGTHDNDTTVGWFRDVSSNATTRTAEQIARERAFTLRYLNARPRDIHWAMIRAAFSSVAATAMVPMQDFLGLPSWARMNRPGIADGNWTWRLAPRVLTPDLAAQIRAMTTAYGRTA